MWVWNHIHMPCRKLLGRACEWAKLRARWAHRRRQSRFQGTFYGWESYFSWHNPFRMIDAIFTCVKNIQSPKQLSLKMHLSTNSPPTANNSAQKISQTGWKPVKSIKFMIFPHSRSLNETKRQFQQYCFYPAMNNSCYFKSLLSWKMENIGSYH